MQDYGGPVGLRLAVAHPDRVRGFIVQNAVASVEGWNPDAVAAFAPFWNNRTPETEAPIRRLLTAETTRFQYTQGASRPERLSPDAWVSDQAHLDRPGNADLQLAMLFDYQDNIAHYPVWKAYLETARPPMLIVWDATIPSSGGGRRLLQVAGTEGRSSSLRRRSLRPGDPHRRDRRRDPRLPGASRSRPADLTQIDASPRRSSVPGAAYLSAAVRTAASQTA